MWSLALYGCIPIQNSDTAHLEFIHSEFPHTLHKKKGGKEGRKKKKKEERKKKEEKKSDMKFLSVVSC